MLAVTERRAPTPKALTLADALKKPYRFPIPTLSALQ